MVDRKEDQSTQFRDTSSGNFEQAAKTATQTQVDPSLADAQTVAQSLGVDLNTGLSQAEAERRLAKFGPERTRVRTPGAEMEEIPRTIQRPPCLPVAGRDPAFRSSHGSLNEPTPYRVRKAAKRYRSTPSSSC